MRSVVVVIGVVLAVALPAQDVLTWRALRDLDVRGADLATRNVVIGALANDPDVHRCLGQRIDDDLIARLGEAVTAAYHRHGFADVEVGSEWSVDGPVITVVEGERTYSGEIRCEGCEPGWAERVRAHLTEDPEKDPPGSGRSGARIRATYAAIWTTDDPVPVDAPFLRRVEAAVIELARGEGLIGVELEASIEPATVTAAGRSRGDLVLRFTNPGQRVPVRSLALLGEDDDIATEILEQLQWTPGELLTSDLLRRLEEQLGATGRYRAVVVDAYDNVPEAFDPLPIVVERTSTDVPFTAEARADIAQLQRGMEGILDRLDRGSVLRISALPPYADETDLPGLTIGEGDASIGMARNGWWIVTPRFSFRSIRELEVEVIATREVFALRCGEFVMDIDPVGGIGVNAMVRTEFDGARMATRWGVGIKRRADRGEPVFLESIHPATAGYLLFGPEPVARRDGDDITVSLGGSEFRIDPAGEVTARSSESAGPRVEIVESGCAAALAAFRERYPDAARTGEVAFSRAIESARASLKGVLEQDDDAAAALLGGMLHTLLEFEWSGGADGAAEFWMQRRVPVNEVGAWALTAACDERVQGWLAEFSAAAALVILGHGAIVGETVRDYAVNDQHGPFAMLAGAAGLRFIGGNPSMIEWFDEAAKRRFDFERCYADIAAIAALLPHADELCSAIVANWRADPLASVVIADASGDAEAMRAGARMLWDAGLGDALRELLLP